jgi:hypothetical protein
MSDDAKKPAVTARVRKRRASLKTEGGHYDQQEASRHR